VPSRATSRPAVVGGDADALSIGELYTRIDRALRGALPDEVWVSGEVRSFNVSSRGHCYLDLVDPNSAQDTGSPVLKVVCWSSRWVRVRSTLDRLGIVLEAGLVVRVRGEVQLYKPRGDISFILSELDTDALLGKVAAERARLIRALVEEGLFDRNRQLPSPRLPLRIGLVASPGTEGFRDFVGQLEGSGMAFHLLVAPTQVQGREAPAAIASAIGGIQDAGCDVLVLVRGGGSKADLATFDSEPVARAIVISSIPVWTGIGHTGDLSVADEVANRSFITPTECGQEVARLVTDVWGAGLESGQRIGRLAQEQLAHAETTLERSRRSTVTSTRAQLDRHADRLSHRTGTLRGTARGQVETRRAQLVGAGVTLARATARSLAEMEQRDAARVARLSALPARQVDDEVSRIQQWRRLLGAFDYQRQLDRGYSVTRDEAGQVIRSVDGLTAGTGVTTQVADGTIAATVTSTAPKVPTMDDEEGNG
jgi:exodeoxyribonuclease VII large subunit